MVTRKQIINTIEVVSADESYSMAEENLVSAIDDIESTVNEIKELLDISSVGDLAQIETAKELIDELSGNLY
jgi:hypothetical protein